MHSYYGSISKTCSWVLNVEAISVISALLVFVLLKVSQEINPYLNIYHHRVRSYCSSRIFRDLLHLHEELELKYRMWTCAIALKMIKMLTDIPIVDVIASPLSIQIRIIIIFSLCHLLAVD